MTAPSAIQPTTDHEIWLTAMDWVRFHMHIVHWVANPYRPYMAADEDDLFQEAIMAAILDKYGSIGASPYRVDVVSFGLETRYGVWMSQCEIKPKGISKKKRTILLNHVLGRSREPSRGSKVENGRSAPGSSSKSCQ